jgi:HAD superfamily hydrolase (TIGR01509 family)
MRLIKGLIFDFDGLILDTETPDYLAWQKVYRSYNLDLDFADWSLGVGAPVEAIDLASILGRKLNTPIDKERILKIQKSFVFEMIQDQEVMPGVIHLIEEAKGAGMKLAIASSSDEQWVKKHLHKFGLIDQFDQICTIDKVIFGKPDPALYCLALKLLGLQPFEAISFEDAPNGIKAAKSANLFCIAVANSMTRHMDLSQADKIFTSLEGVNLEELLILANI